MEMAFIAKRCLFFIEMAKGRERQNSPGPFNFRGCDLIPEYLPATEEVRVQLPAAAPILHRLRVSMRPSLQNSAHSGQHGGSLPFSFGVVADKQCTCFASRLMWERYPPTPPIAGNSTNAQREAS